MLSERLSLALDRGLFLLPEGGTIAVVGARSGDDLSLLPRERTEVVTRLYPDFAHFERLGYETATSLGGPYALTIVVLPRARADARRVIAEAVAATDGPIVVDGQKTDGIDGIVRELKRRAEVGEVLSKAHGKICVVTGGDFDDWTKETGTLIDGRFRTAPGVFSADGIDPGSGLLAEALPDSLKGDVVDLGAGWGYLSDRILAREGVRALDIVEADHAALEMARANISDPRARFFWADALTFAPIDRVDHVVTNPPFHTGRKAEASLGQGFIRAAAAMLRPGGSLWLVANRHLPYEQTLEDAFSSVRVINSTASYKIFHATSPRRPRKG